LDNGAKQSEKFLLKAQAFLAQDKA